MVNSMDRWKDKVAVVTGASAGIGAAIVEALVESGLKVAGLARRKDKVEELAQKLEGKSGELHALKVDITKEEDILEAFKWIEENLGPISILVNNAGVGKNTTVIDGDTDTFKQILDTNVLGLTIATREAIKQMRKNNIDGHVVLINSILGHKVAPLLNFSVYPASKFAVTALTETLRQELVMIGSKIKVTSISPGVVATEIWEVSGCLANKDMVERLKTFSQLQPEDIADTVVYTLGTPPHMQIHDIIVKPVGETL